MMSLSAAALLSALLVLGAQPPPPEAKELVAEAQLDYKLGRFEAAFEKYRRAYELAPLPDFLFNMAQCQRNLKDLDLAVFFFKSYARDTNDPNERERVTKLITELEQTAHHQAQAQAEMQAQTATRAEPKTIPSLIAQQSPPALERDPPSGGDSILGEWWFWTALAVAAAAATTTGVILASDPSTEEPPRGTIGNVSAGPR